MGYFPPGWGRPGSRSRSCKVSTQRIASWPSGRPCPAVANSSPVDGPGHRATPPPTRRRALGSLAPARVVVPGPERRAVAPTLARTIRLHSTSSAASGKAVRSRWPSRPSSCSCGVRRPTWAVRKPRPTPHLRRRRRRLRPPTRTPQLPSQLLKAERLDFGVDEVPRVYVSAAESWTDCTIRYLVPVRSRRRWSSALLVAITRELATPEHQRRVIPAYPRREIAVRHDADAPFSAPPR